jgi:hypothetical protein
MADNKKTIQIEFKATGYPDLVKQLREVAKSSEDLIKSNDKLNKINRKIPMSLNKMTMDLKELGSSFKSAGVNVNVLKRAYDGHKTSIEKVRRATRSHIRTLRGLENQNKRVSKNTRILGGTLAVVRSKLLLFNFAVGFAIRGLGRFAMQASKVESMERAFITLAGAGESSRVALQRLEQATNGTMSQFDLFQQANNAMVLGVSKNSDEMAEMFDIAQRLGRALGRDTASSVESLITGIGRQSRLMLDNIGIIVKADEAYESYAKTLGISVDQLTDQEKKQAFLTATMESARQKVKSLGEETLTSQDTYDKLTTATSNLASETGQFLQPALTAIAKQFTKVAEKAGSYLKSINLANEPILETMTNEEKLERLIAKRLKQQALLDTFVSGRGVASQEAYNQQSQKVAELGQKILFTMFKIDEERQKEVKELDKETEAGKKGNEVKDYRAQILQKELEIIKQRNEAMLGEFAIVEQLALIEEQRDLIKLQLLQKDITKQDADKKDLELTGKKIKLEEQLDTVRMESASNTLGALAQLAQAGRSTFELGKALALAQAIIDAYGAGNKVLNSKLPFPTNVIAMAGVIATGLNNVSKIRAQKFEAGGLVGGKLHSQGGTMIEAEKGEFVMSRNAVQSIGAETLNQINQTGSAGVTVNISAPLVDETVVDTIIPAIEKAQRMNLA